MSPVNKRKTKCLPATGRWGDWWGESEGGAPPVKKWIELKNKSRRKKRGGDKQGRTRGGDSPTGEQEEEEEEEELGSMLTGPLPAGR